MYEIDDMPMMMECNVKICAKGMMMMMRMMMVMVMVMMVMSVSSLTDRVVRRGRRSVGVVAGAGAGAGAGAVKSCDTTITETIAIAKTANMNECHASAKALISALTDEVLGSEDRPLLESKSVVSHGVIALLNAIMSPTPSAIYASVMDADGRTETHSFVIVTNGDGENFRMIQSWINQYDQEVTYDSSKGIDEVQEFAMNLLKGASTHFNVDCSKKLFFRGKIPQGATSLRFNFGLGEQEYTFRVYPITKCAFPEGVDNGSPSSVLRIAVHALQSTKHAAEGIEAMNAAPNGDGAQYCKTFCDSKHTLSWFSTCETRCNALVAAPKA